MDLQKAYQIGQNAIAYVPYAAGLGSAAYDYFYGDPPSGGGGNGGGGPRRRRPFVPANTNLSHGSAIVMGKRRRKKRRSRFQRKISKVLNKTLKRKLAAVPTLLSDIKSTWLTYSACAVNKVGWSEFVVMTEDDLKSYLQHEVLINTADGTTTMQTVVPHSTYNLGYKSFKQKMTVDCYGKNNSNAPCELVFYWVQCVEQTSYTALNYVEDQYLATYKTKALASPAAATSAALALRDNFQQYWSSSKQNVNSLYKIIKRVKVVLQPGDEIRLIFSKVYKLMNQNNLGDETYAEGTPQLLCRIQGVPSHDVTTSTSTMMSPAQVDFLMKRRIQSWALGDPSVIQPQITLANSGFNSGSAVLAEDANVGAYDAA